MKRYLSVCSGIEAASVAWHELGWKPLAFSEIEDFPRAVLQHHYPDVPLHGDFTTLRDEPWIVDADILVGGTPCQAFSVAGLRQSLADDRGNLTLEFVRLANAIDDLRRDAGRDPAYILWENVPGVLSVSDNAFGAFLAGLCGCDAALVSPNDYGWSDAGVVAGPKRWAAWRVLDAQYHGLAQRRRRVFVLSRGGAGAWRCADALLPIVESLSWNPSPRRQAGQGIAHSVTTRAGNGSRPAGATGNIVAFGGNNQSGPIDVATAQTAHGGTGRMDFESETFVAQSVAAGSATQQDAEQGLLVAHALRADGFDASEDGTGRGTPLVPVAIPIQEVNKRTGVSSTDLRAGDGIGDAGDPMFTLGTDSRHGVAICFDETQITSATNRCQPRAGDPSHPLAAGARHPTIAFNARQDPDVSGDIASPLGNQHNGLDNGVLQSWRVRRLTPTECARLQGFPDDYLDIIYRGKPAADGPKYRALGNSMAVNVMRWLGRRIEMVEKIK